MEKLMSEREKEIKKIVDKRLTNLQVDEVLEVKDLSEKEMNYFGRLYNNDEYKTIGSDTDFESITEDGKLRYCFSLMRRLQDAKM